MRGSVGLTSDPMRITAAAVWPGGYIRNQTHGMGVMDVSMNTNMMPDMGSSNELLESVKQLLITLSMTLDQLRWIDESVMDDCDSVSYSMAMGHLENAVEKCKSILDALAVSADQTSTDAPGDGKM